MFNIKSLPLIGYALGMMRRLFYRPLHHPDSQVDYRVLGSEYGGWPVIQGSLSRESRVYSFGVGQDITFDLALISEYGCVVEAFDPTPRCARWLECQVVSERFHFHLLGLSDRTQLLRFFAPPEDSFVSYTIAERVDAKDAIELPVRSLNEIMLSLGDRELDFMKMDIEGSEYLVISDMIGSGILPKQLCVEFHHGRFGFTEDQTRKAVARLREVGYRLHYVSPSGREYGFHI